MQKSNKINNTFNYLNEMNHGHTGNPHSQYRLALYEKVTNMEAIMADKWYKIGQIQSSDFYYDPHGVFEFEIESASRLDYYCKLKFIIHYRYKDSKNNVNLYINECTGFSKDDIKIVLATNDEEFKSKRIFDIYFRAKSNWEEYFYRINSMATAKVTAYTIDAVGPLDTIPEGLEYNLKVIDNSIGTLAKVNLLSQYPLKEIKDIQLIKFNNIKFANNIDFDISTGYYTVTKSGIYSISALLNIINMGSSDINNTRVKMYVGIVEDSKAYYYATKVQYISCVAYKTNSIELNDLVELKVGESIACFFSMDEINKVAIDTQSKFNINKVD